MSAVSLTLRGLQAVMAVHRTHHFGHAAQSLGVPPSTLSQQVASVESHLGQKLFDRTPRAVITTPFGLEMIARAEPVLASFDQFLSWAEEIGDHTDGLLRIGLVAGLDRTLTGRVLRAVTEELPRHRVDVRSIDFLAAEPALLAEEIDVALTPGPVSLERTDLRGTEVWSEPRALMVARAHPLATRSSVRLADVRDEVVITAAAGHPVARWWAVDPRPDGSPVRYGPPARNLEEVVHQVAAGRGINLTAASAEQSVHHPDVAYVPLIDAEPATVWVLARAGERARGVLVTEAAARAVAPRA